jgi:hypothetical protein
MRITGSGATATAAAAAGLWLRPGRLGEVLAVAVLLASAALPLAGAESPPAAGPASAQARHDYEDALRKSLLYFEAQRSGRLPHGQRVAWRDHSGLTDGLEQGVRLLTVSSAVITRRRPIDDGGGG